MSIYIGNNLEDSLKILETENASLKKYNNYHQMVHEIDHMSDLHVDMSFYKQLRKIDNYHKIAEWIDCSIRQSTVIQELVKKRPTLSNLDQTQNRRRYVNFENGSHFICSSNLNNPELTIFIMTNIASGDQEIVNSLIGNNNKKVNLKFITFYKTFGGLGLLISKAQSCAYVAIANDDSSSIKPDLKFLSSKSNCAVLNKWHVISVTWSNSKDLSNCWSNGEKLITFTTGNIKGFDHCFIGDLGKIPGWSKTHLMGCIGEIIGFQRILTDEETSYIQQYLITKWVEPVAKCEVPNKAILPDHRTFFSSEVHDKGDPLHVWRS